MPGDEIIPLPVSQHDNAINIAASPRTVWPWLAQMGADRAGWYSYDFLDNGGRKSSETLIENYQHIAVGDVFPALPGATDAFILTEFVEDLLLVLGVPGDDPVIGDTGSPEWKASYNRANWTFILREHEGGTRLHVRARLGHLVLRLPFFGRWRVPNWFARMLALPVHFIMQRKMLNEIRRRAELTILTQANASRLPHSDCF